MKTMCYSESRANYATTLDDVVNDCEEVAITRSGKDPVVIVSLPEHQSFTESAYLLRSPANVRHLLGAIDRLENGPSSKMTCSHEVCLG